MSVRAQRRPGGTGRDGIRLGHNQLIVLCREGFIGQPPAAGGAAHRSASPSGSVYMNGGFKGSLWPDAGPVLPG